MNLNKLTIKDFKSIHNLTNFKLTNLNILIGSNGAGKSNFIDFFRLLHSICKGNLHKFIQNGGGISNFLFNSPKITKKLKFEISLDDYDYCFSIVPSIREQCIISEEAYYKRNSPKQFNDNTDNFSLLIYETIISWQIYRFFSTNPIINIKQANNSQNNKYLHTDGSNIASYLFNLKNTQPDIYNEIIDTIRVVIPYFNDFEFIPEELVKEKKINFFWLQKGSNEPKQPYYLSDGSIRFICLAAALLQPTLPSMIIIDGPELGLHPFAINILADLIQNAAKKTQLIIATQSPSLIDNFAIENIITVNRKNGESVFSRLEEKDFHIWLENYSISELWKKNIITGNVNHE